MRELQDLNETLTANCQRLKQQVVALEDEAINKDTTIMKLMEELRCKNQMVDSCSALQHQVIDQVDPQPFVAFGMSVY